MPLSVYLIYARRELRWPHSDVGSCCEDPRHVRGRHSSRYADVRCKGADCAARWLPGVSYWFSHPKGSIGNRPRSDTIRQIIAGLATGIAGIEPPVTASATRVETPLLLSPVITNQQTCVHDLSHLRLRVNQLPQLPLLYR